MGGKEADFEWDFNCKCPLSKDELTTGIAVRDKVFVVILTRSGKSRVVQNSLSPPFAGRGLG